MRRIVCVVALLVLRGSAPAFAEIQPSFEIKTVGWNATQIVVTKRTGTSYRVLESWQGTLAINATIELPTLTPPKAFEATRAVLFLREGDKPNTWKSATDFGELDESVVWLFGGRAYAKTQLSNPGPSEIQVYPLDETKLRAKVGEFVVLKKRFEAAKHVTDLEKRVEALVPLARTEQIVRDEALDALGAVGPKAVPALRAYLATETLYPGTAVKALVAAAGKDAASELIAIVREELGFWKAVTPSLAIGWWNGDRADVDKLRNRYMKLIDALWELRPLKAAAARGPVKALRDYWRSQKALEDRSGLSQMSEAADDLLRDLR